MTEIEAFRRDTRAWLETNCPAEMRQPVASDEDICWGGRRYKFQSDAQRRWLALMVERGWTVPTWPPVYGGAGLGAAEADVLRGELRVLGCRPPLESFGIWMLGPALLEYGSEAQKLEHLPRIARGEIRWCQGFSEPNAGSDLASIATRAEVHENYFTINGQKIWTSYADQADWIFCLVRTDMTQKHGGISFVLFDMETPGVSTRSIQLISGKSPFCETFFENVQVPRANLVGELNGGWTIAKYLLGYEREMIGASGESSGVKRIGLLAADTVGVDGRGRLLECDLRSQIARFEIDETAFEAWMSMAAGLARRSEDNLALPSALKYYGAELNKRRWELLMSVGGAAALEWEGECSGNGYFARSWLRSKGNSIEGGTSEVMLNIIAKRILGLPGA